MKSRRYGWEAWGRVVICGGGSGGRGMGGRHWVRKAWWKAWGREGMGERHGVGKVWVEGMG